MRRRTIDVCGRQNVKFVFHIKLMRRNVYQFYEREKQIFIQT